MDGTRRVGRVFGRRLGIAVLVVTAAAAVVGSVISPSARADVAGPAGASVPAASAPTGTGGTTCAPTAGGGTTCTGTFSGDTAFDPSLPNTQHGIGGMTGVPPKVTVDQTTGLTNQIVHVTWANFTPSFYPHNNVPTAGYKFETEYYPVYIEECSGTAAEDYSAVCDALPNGDIQPGETGTMVEDYTEAGTSKLISGDCAKVPSDKVCGTGFADIRVQTSVQDPNLNCAAPDQCSIAVMPDWGGNYLTGKCENHKQDFPFRPGTTGILASDGANSEKPTVCATADKIVVPLDFAPTPASACPAGNSYEFSADGSPDLERVMAQWQPGWCTSSPKVDFNYDSGVNESQARSRFLGTGGTFASPTDVALVTDPASSTDTAGSTRQFTYAPVATTGISIAYYIDNQATQRPVTNIKLDARLVAKMLTQSYALALGTCPAGQVAETDTCDPAVTGNPVDIFHDPEFYKLNPEYSQVVNFPNLQNTAFGQFLPMVLSGNSDMIFELTRWVASDPDAVAFLEGKPDPWGMHVNKNYLSAPQYPVDYFQTFDNGFTADYTNPSDFNDPFAKTIQESWIFVTGVDNIAFNLAEWSSSDFSWVGQCPNSSGIIEPPPCPNGIPPNNPNLGPQQFPNRALFAVMDSGTAATDRFPTAALVNSAGKAIAPTTDSMSAALTAMKTNPDGVTQYQDFAATSPAAYPLTEVQYAMVPTCGLPSAKSSAIATFLQDVANSQIYGVGPGQIPPFGGYLALTAAQQQQTVKAEQAVGTQNCKSLPPDQTVSGQNPPPGFSSASTGLGSGNGLGGNGLGNGAIPNPLASGPPSFNSRPGGTPNATASATPTIGLGQKAADTSSDVKYILPAALAAGALLALGGPLAYSYGTTGRVPFPRLRRPRFPRRRSGGSGGTPPEGGANG